MTRHELHKDKLKKDWLCICPKCEETHTLYFFWTGNGQPRKYCPECEKFVKKHTEITKAPDPSSNWKHNPRKT